MEDKSKPKRKPRHDTGRKIVVRVTDEEYERLKREATGKTTVSRLVRGRLFGNGMRNQDVLRQVEALHVLGRQVKALSESGCAPQLTVTATLGQIRLAILALADHLPSGAHAQGGDA